MYLLPFTMVWKYCCSDHLLHMFEYPSCGVIIWVYAFTNLKLKCIKFTLQDKEQLIGCLVLVLIRPDNILAVIQTSGNFFYCQSDQQIFRMRIRLLNILTANQTSRYFDRQSDFRIFRPPLRRADISTGSETSGYFDRQSDQRILRPLVQLADISTVNQTSGYFDRQSNQRIFRPPASQSSGYINQSSKLIFLFSIVCFSHIDVDPDPYFERTFTSRLSRFAKRMRIL